MFANAGRGAQILTFWPWWSTGLSWFPGPGVSTRMLQVRERQDAGTAGFPGQLVRLSSSRARRVARGRRPRQTSRPAAPVDTIAIVSFPRSESHRTVTAVTPLSASRSAAAAAQAYRGRHRRGARPVSEVRAARPGGPETPSESFVHSACLLCGSLLRLGSRRVS